MLKHEQIEKSVGLLIVLTLFTVIWGGLLEIVPLFFQKSTTTPVEGVKPYDAVRLVGRDVFVREGCYLCHSQMIRPFRAETERYGHYSVAGESVYDHPFQWGSKRTGPDLARVGNRYSDDWHREHLVNPRSVVPESIMPGYPFLLRNEIDPRSIASHLVANADVGVPYSQEMIDNAAADMVAQAGGDGFDAFATRYPKATARDFDGQPQHITEMDALIAYLQMLGTLVDFNAYKAEANLR